MISFKKFRCSLWSLLTPLSIYLPILVYLKKYNDPLVLSFLPPLLILWFFVTLLFFPRIVINIDKGKVAEEISVWCNGIRIIRVLDPDALPAQISFQVWKRARYGVHVVSGKNSRSRETANCYDHSVCHLDYPEPKLKQETREDA